VPEVFLAREAQMAYATVGIVTDYDCWLEDPAQHVSVGAIFELYGRSLAKARTLLDGLLAADLPVPEASIRNALANSMMSPDSTLTAEQLDWLQVLRS
jgi:5'-methylthioadenosine phosphorylase